MATRDVILFALSLSAVAHGFTYELISLTNSNVHRRSLLRKDMMREWIANDIVQILHHLVLIVT